MLKLAREHLVNNLVFFFFHSLRYHCLYSLPVGNELRLGCPLLGAGEESDNAAVEQDIPQLLGIRMLCHCPGHAVLRLPDGLLQESHRDRLSDLDEGSDAAIAGADQLRSTQGVLS